MLSGKMFSCFEAGKVELQKSIYGGEVLAEIPFVRGITEGPLWIGSTQAPGAISRSK